jgi:hypothetical protein
MDAKQTERRTTADERRFTRIEKPRMNTNLRESSAERYGFAPVEELTPEKIFSARWAMALIRQALNRLNREYVAKGKGATFRALRGFLDPIYTKSLPSYGEAAAQQEVSVGALKTLKSACQDRHECPPSLA